ncbi:hypothetical protein [Microvirga arabica]|uniref:hypothetical protein n=1 Tax=Microvirga arabica TaxID=1128671 RepID=UPI00366C0791
MKQSDRHVVVDVETAQSYDHIIEIAAVEIIGRTISSRSCPEDQTTIGHEPVLLCSPSHFIG